MFAVALAVTELVVIVKLAVVAPAGMVTEAGTDAAALSLDRATVSPLAGAAAPLVTVPVVLSPPATELDVSVTDETATDPTKLIPLTFCPTATG
jgi:hypothetical protein